MQCAVAQDFGYDGNIGTYKLSVDSDAVHLTGPVYHSPANDTRAACNANSQRLGPTNTLPTPRVIVPPHPLHTDTFITSSDRLIFNITNMPITRRSIALGRTVHQLCRQAPESDQHQLAVGDTRRAAAADNEGVRCAAGQDQHHQQRAHRWV